MISIMTIMSLSQMFITMGTIYLSNQEAVDTRDQPNVKKIVQGLLRIRLPNRERLHQLLHQPLSVPAVRIPFSGNMLSLETKKIGTLQPVPPPPSSLSASSPPSSTYANVPQPVKKTIQRQFAHHISSAQKRLFHPGHPQPHTPVTQPVPGNIPPLDDQVGMRCNLKKNETICSRNCSPSQGAG